MSHITIAASERAFEQIFTLVRDNFSFSKVQRLDHSGRSLQLTPSRASSVEAPSTFTTMALSR